MTTITPTPQTTINLTIDLTAPFHHGAGTAGNTSLLRTQDVVQPDGTVSRVPFLSAASIRHALRDALAWHTAHTLDIEPGTLSKGTVDLLWTGGAVSSTGAKTDLDMMRRVEEHYPALSMLGYAAKSDIITGTLRASDLILVCQENDWRLPKHLRGARRAAAYRTEEFGPRHITGIRAEESRIRTLVQHRFGDATERTARPIGTWAATDIFAYLAGHNLPVHPAYAMSHGGTLDRRWLRVHALGGVTGADKGRADWEESYFGDVIRSSRLRDTLMQEIPGNRHDALSASVIAAQSEIPISDAQQALESLHRQALAVGKTYAGRQRWHRTVSWPPEPKWINLNAHS